MTRFQDVMTKGKNKMPTDKMPACSFCGRKPNRARKIFHKADCPSKIEDAGVVPVESIEITGTIKFGPK